ncbi:unnamed protein product [Rhodiola kirilowii]
MDNSATTMENSSQTSIKVTRINRAKILMLIIVIILSVAIASYFNSCCPPSAKHDEDSSIVASIKQACNNTRNSSLCFATLTSSTHPGNATSFRHLLEISLHEASSLAVDVRSHLSNLSHVQDLTTQNKNAFKDCLEMMDLTINELQQAMDHIDGFRVQADWSYHNLKTLLSAAMTNENTCTEGFSDVNKSQSRNHKMLKNYVHGMLDPISTILSNCLAIITCMEGRDKPKKPQSLISKTAKADKFPTWIESGDRNLMEAIAKLRPNVTVASDGTGDYRLISEAVRMAPNRSTSRYIIHVKTGLYNEGVRITRDKTNIMLIGDGMNSTVITGTRSVADGFTTFNSATLTVTGDKFLARDLTVVNTAGPQKHQAVAVRVTSNAAFYRCNFTSYQDTLYAHSLRQFYRECTIQGTIDFIFGNAAAVFQNCRILVRKPMLGQQNVITAQGRNDPNQNTGISIQNCVISAASGFTLADMKYYPTFIGRPWRNFSRTIVMKSYLGHMIQPQGWCRWNQYSNLDTVEYIEYMNFGPGSNTTQRVKWGGYRNDCSDEMVKPFTMGEFLLGVDGWFETTGFPLSQGF